VGHIFHENPFEYVEINKKECKSKIEKKLTKNKIMALT